MAKRNIIDAPIPSIFDPWDDGVNAYKGNRIEDAIKDKFQKHDNILATITGSETIVFTVRVDIMGTIYANSNEDYVVTITHVSKSVFNDGSEQPFDNNVKLTLERTLGSNVEYFELGNIKGNGTSKVNIKQYLVDGSSIRFRTQSYEKEDVMARTSSFDVKKINLTINTANDNWWAVPYVKDEQWQVPLILGININCKLVATLSKGGIIYSTKTIPSSLLGTNYSLDMAHPSENRGKSGVYDLKVQLIPDDPTLSDLPPVVLEKRVLCILADDTENYIIVNNEKSIVDNYAESTLFDYSLRVGFGNPLVSIYSTVDGRNVAVVEDMSLVSGIVYNHNVSLQVERETTDNFDIVSKIKLDGEYVYENSIEVNNTTGYGATSGAVMSISFAGRSNNEANRQQLINTVNGDVITPIYTDLTWSEVDGYQQGFFRLLSEEKMSIPIKPFSRGADGVTFEVKYRSRNILDYNTEIIKVYDEMYSEDGVTFQGLKVTSNKITFFDGSNHSEDNQSFPYTAEDVNVLTVVVYPNYRPEGGDSAYNAVMIYLNGQKQREYFAGTSINLNV